jgi:peptide/nickel transport system substrate-binding protein
VKSKRSFVLLTFLLAVALVAMLAVACGGGTSTPGSDGGTGDTSATDMPRSILECPQGEQSAETPQYGGTMVMLHDAPPTSFGAFFLNTGFADVQMARYSLENLIGLDADGEPVAQLATSWDVDATAKTITFHLRQGVKFHDGTDFNAEAVKWNLEKYMSGAKKDLQDINTIDVVDPYTVRLNMSKMDCDFIQSLSYTCAGKMISPTAYDTMGEEVIKMHPVGTGPFVFDSYEPNVVLKFKRNPNYWQPGLPYLDGVEIRYVKDELTKLTAYKSGEAQVFYGIPVNALPELTAMGHTISTRVITLWGIAGDSTDPACPFSKLEVRQGMAYAINTKADVDGVYEGLSPSTYQLAIEGYQGYNPAVVGYPYDPVKAKELLSKNSITLETPWKVTLSYWPNDTDLTDLFTLVQEDLAAVGVQIKLDGGDYAKWYNKTQEGFANQLIHFRLSYNGLEARLVNSLSNSFTKNRTFFPNVALSDAYNAAYDAIVAATTPEERELGYQALQKIAIDEDCMVIPLVGVLGRIAKVPDLHDYGFGDRTTGEFLPERAWLSGAANTGTTAAAAATTSGQ